MHVLYKKSSRANPRKAWVVDEPTSHDIHLFFVHIMVSSALGLLRTKPSSAHGGRSRAQRPNNSVPGRHQQQPPIQDGRTEMEKSRHRSMLSQVQLSHSVSDVSSIPDYDIFSHTETEVLRSRKDKEMRTKNGAGQDVGRARSMETESDLFAGLNDGQLEKLIQDTEVPVLASAPLIDASKKKKEDITKASVKSSHVVASAGYSQHKSVLSGCASNPGFNGGLSGTAPKIFTSYAANNYYHAMTTASENGSRVASRAVGRVASKVAGKATSKATTEVEKAATKEASKEVIKKAQNGKRTEKKRLDELVDEALAVAKSPEEVAQYLIAQNDSGCDKKTLYAAIIAKLMQQHQHNSANCNSNNNDRQSKKSSAEPKGATVQASPPGAIPPVTSIEHSTSGNLSTTSSITRDSASWKPPPVPEEHPTEVGASKGSRSGSAPSGFSDEYDPPIAEYPSPVCSPKSDDLGYPTPITVTQDEEYDSGIPEKLKLKAIAGEDGSAEEEADNGTRTSDGSAASRNPSVEKGAEAAETESRDDASRPTGKSNGKPGLFAGHMTKHPSAPIAEESIEHDLGSYNNYLGVSTMLAPAPNGTAKTSKKIGRPGSFSTMGSGDAASDQSGRSGKSGIGHARRVTDILSRTGSSFSVNSNKKDPSRRTLRSVRSMSPNLFKKKKFAEPSRESAADGALPPSPESASPQSEGPKNGESGGAAAPASPLGRGKTLRVVRSMSPSLFSKKQRAFPGETGPTAYAGGGDSGSGDNSAAPYTASSSVNLPTGSSVHLSRAAMAADAPDSVVGSSEKERPVDTAAIAADFVAVPSSRAVATGADPSGVGPAGSTYAMHLVKSASRDAPETPLTPITANTSRPRPRKKLSEPEDERECIGSAVPTSGSESRESSSFRESQPTMMSKLTNKKGGALALPPRIPSRSATTTPEAAATPTSVDSRLRHREMRRILTLSEDDGSVECSVTPSATSVEGEGINEMLQLTTDGGVVVTNLDPVGSKSVQGTAESAELAAKGAAGPASAAEILTADPNDGGIECVIKGVERRGLETTVVTLKEAGAPRIGHGLAPLPVPQKQLSKRRQGRKENGEEKNENEKKGGEEKCKERGGKKMGRLALAREKYKKHQTKSPMTAEERPEGTKQSSKAAVEGVSSLDADDSTISSGESRRSKRERFEKIRKYRNKTIEKTDTEVDAADTKEDNGDEDKVEKIEEIHGNNDDAMKKKDDKKRASKNEERARSDGSASTKITSSSKSNDVVEETKKQLAMLDTQEKNHDVVKEKEQLRQLDPMLSPGSPGTMVSGAEDTKRRNLDLTTLGKNSAQIRDDATPLGSQRTKTDMRVSSVPPDSKLDKMQTKNLAKVETAGQEENSLADVLNKESIDVDRPKEKEPKQGKQTLYARGMVLSIAQSESPGGCGDHPVKLVKFDPNHEAEDDDTHLDVSLPPEIKDGKKIKIWDEEASFMEDLDEGRGCQARASFNKRRGFFGEKCYTYRDDANDSTTITGQGTIDDIDSLFDKTAEDTDAAREERSYDRQAPTSSLFSCGAIQEPARLKESIATEVRGAAHSIRARVPPSVRNLLGVFDITKDGGVDVLKENMMHANDQLFGRKPVGSTPGSFRSNPQSETMTPRAQKMTVDTIDEKKRKQAISEMKKKKLYLGK